MFNKMLKNVSTGLFAGLLLSASSPVLGNDGYSSFCDPCACADQFWVDADYLYWQIKNSQDPVVLVSEGATAATATPVIGGGSVENNWRSGGKFGLGYWFEETRHYGVEANYFFLGKDNRSKTVSTDGSIDSNYLIAPFIDATTGLAVIDNYIAFPGDFSGTATRKVNNWMQGAELNGLAVFPCDCSLNFSALVGFRFWNFDENLAFDTSSPYVIGTPGVYETYDKFDVQNNFYGGQIGAGVDYTYDCFSINAKVKVALGAMCEELNISGVTLTNDFNGFGTVQEFAGGYFALPTNIGHHNKTNFAVIPEVSINLGYQVTEYFSVKLGYSFMYVSNMLWAGKQIDPVINSTQSVEYTSDPAATLVGVASPTASLKTSSLWTQGVNAGVEFRF
ncbi:MAG: BBP7 family outer membrane beta-barrel protein [Parachlamydiaceae bacterium]